jgi:excinuclease ABC subunit A
MNIEIDNARANNLKGVSLSIPHKRITGFTGVSGSGKSTLLKNIISATGSLNFTRLKSKTVQNALLHDKFVEADQVNDLPQTLFIEVVNHVANSASTLSTISGIHDVFRDMFVQISHTHCLRCESEVQKGIFPLTHHLVEHLCIDIEYDKNYLDKRAIIQTLGEIEQETFYDREGVPAKSKRARSLVSIIASPLPLSESKFKELVRMLNVTVFLKVKGIKTPINPLHSTVCMECLSIVPRLTKSRFSFNVNFSDGGGACRRCNGTGRQYVISPKSIIVDDRLSIFDGGLRFVTGKGLKYTTVTEKFIRAFCDSKGISIKRPIARLKKKELEQLLFGSDELIHFSDRVGGKKSLVFQGIANYLVLAFLKNKKRESLASIVNESVCPNCEDTRIDPDIDTFTIHKATIRDLLRMRIQDLRLWVQNCQSKMDIQGLLIDLDSRLFAYEQVCCSHLHFNRQSSTLSGGELQRIRLCRMLNSNIKNICYLLDEPSSGLHYDDIEKVALLLREICNRGNTLIFIEHNKKLLSACDHIVELGPSGGPEGGQLIFSGAFGDFLKSNTPTSKFLCGETSIKRINNNSSSSKVRNAPLSFSGINHNNLQNMNVAFPRNKFTTICGVSGSGKSSLITMLNKFVSSDVKKYGFDDVVHLKQAGIKSNKSTSVGELLQVENNIAKLYAKHTDGAISAFKHSSISGKCSQCKGKGFITGPAGEKLDVCDECQGRRYDKKTLSFLYRELTIYDALEIPLSQLSGHFPGEKVEQISAFSAQLGIGYLTLSRSAKSLSKGEYQRVILARLLVENETGSICFLDEPSKGLHCDDILKLTELIKRLASQGNTIVAVEHNPDAIRESDYIIELGPGSGIHGGKIVYRGLPQYLEGTPTARAIRDSQAKVAAPASIYDATSDESFYIKRNGKKIAFQRNIINHVAENADDILEVCKRVEADFLDAAIQNGTALVRRDVGDSKNISVPMMFLVDFDQKNMRYDTSVYNALNASSTLMRRLLETNPTEISLLRHVFDDRSIVGKCQRCSGVGIRDGLARDLFLDGAELSRRSIRFLKNSTNFKEASCALKKSANIDIAKDWSAMTRKEKNTLFDGHATCLTGRDNARLEWRGLIENAIFNHKYYPDKKSGAKFSKLKEKKLCQFCRGELLNIKFSKHAVWGLTYSDWMTLPISSILDRTSASFKKSNLGLSLEYLNEFSEEEVKLIGRMGDYSQINQGMIKLISMYFNNIYGSSIIVKNQNKLTPDQASIVEEIIRSWKKTNVIIMI